ncbi:ABC transporter substrate-binding protein [Paraoerskovia sediminicola]|uniref:ABC transporter substrate-binding protein n=1 Tax=Paraoerskovia sediminicola TaxID=1138587 RepID=A0ABM8G0R6_9CELL|nr:ABC transporter substrate-binding protein [Paraoerskovia sediminicola]BDZ41642.1 ABC transporter substrate-binding protein [Paraoerskovia sediminicola]
MTREPARLRRAIVATAALAGLAVTAASTAACAPIDTAASADPAASPAATAAATATATADPADTGTASAESTPTPSAAPCEPSGDAVSELPDGPRTAVVADEAIRPVSAGTPGLPVTVDSADGGEVTVTDTSRIIAVDLYGTLGEIVWSLGLGDQVVGRDASTAFTEAADVPVVTGDGHALNVEAVLGLDPSVILADDSILTDATRTRLESSDVPVVLFDATRTLDGIEPRIEAVATALGVPDAGTELAERTAAEICAAVATVPAETGDPTVAFLYLRGGNIKLLFGPGSGADELLAAVGAVDAGTEIGLSREYEPITSEALIASAPDAYLVMSGGLESAGGVDALWAMPGVGQTPAGEGQRVVDVPDSDLLTFGPRTAATIVALSAALYGSAS